MQGCCRRNIRQSCGPWIVSSKFEIVAKAKLRKKAQAEREAKKGKRPKLPYKKASDSAGQSLGAITEMPTFKEYLINEAKYYKHDENEPLYRQRPGDKTVRIIASKGSRVQIQDVHSGERSELTRGTFNRLYKKLVKGWQHMGEAKYYLAKDDWQDDVDDNEVGIGVCPKCKGTARYETDHHPRGGMWSHWVCQNDQCGYEQR